ncbi:MAG: glycosyltransferase family 4 protein [Candidatus Saccharibacteria bacterium]|nr:glycosyltransferase family 4 protein [Rhodoferax sp.]
MTPHKADGSRKRVLVLTSTFPRWVGDTEPAFVYALCERLSEHFDIWVLAPHAPGAKSREHFGSMNVVRFRYFFEWGESLAYQGGIMAKLRSKPLRHLLVPPFLMCQWFAVLRLLLSQRFDIVHAHWLFPQGFAAGIVKRLLPRFPVLVCTSHGTDLNGLQGGLFTRIKRFAVGQSDAFTVVSAAMQMKAQSLDIDLQQTSDIPMGVDARTLFTPDTTAQRASQQLLFVGRLDAQKGIELLIRAMPDVLARYPDCILKIIGHGPQREELQQQVGQLGLVGRVVFVGAVPNAELPSHFRTATLMVFPSVGAEGLGLVCAEALACGCPVVASDLPAVQEIVQHEVSGFVFRQSDCEDLTSKILLMLADPVRRSAMGVAGRAHVLAHFDWTQVVAAFTDVFNRVNRQG